MALNMFASFRGYVLASLLLTTAVVSHAVYLKRFFYRSVIYLANSKFAILAVGNMALVSVLLLWRLAQAIFLGPLRFREVERLHIRARDAIIECCFAISVFRDEFKTKFVALIMILLLLKSLHWLSKDRIEFLEEQPLSPVRTHLRLVGLMSVLLLLDLFLVRRFASITLGSKGATMYVLFAFEFTIMVIELLSDMVRYGFLVVDTSMEGHWEEKGMFSFYVELLADLCQLTVYILFFIYVQVFYSFPFHIIRELYMTFSKFQRRCSDFLRYRRVVSTMNDLFADATEEELDEGDRTCIICREEMQTAKKLACGHIFHARCLQSWLKRQLSCPTCRATIDVNGNAGQSRNAQNADPENQQQPNQPNNNNNNNNNMNNIANANVNNVPPPNQGAVNIGEAGVVRLFNLANQWWNQVMIELGAGMGAGAVGGAGGGAGARRGVPAADANAIGGGGAGVGIGVGNGVGGGAAAANPRRVHPQRSNPRQEPPMTNGIPANAFLRGPNAVAHMQLRARRRGAWPHPYQPYQMPHMHNYPYQVQQHHQGNLNPFLPQNQQMMAPNAVQAPQINANANLPSAANMVPTGAPASIGNGSTANQTHEGRSLREDGVAQPADVAAHESSTGAPIAQGASTASSSRTDGQSQSLSRGEPVGSSLAPETQPPQNAASNPSSTIGPDPSGPGAFRQAEIPSGADTFGQVIPLERLLSIQEQIEALRNEVMELIILATSGPPLPEIPQRNPTPSGRGPSEPRNRTDASQDTTSSREESGTEPNRSTTENLNREQQIEEDENSDAARLRRRRIEFLERNTGS